MSRSIAGLSQDNRRRVGMLVHFALSQLWYASEASLDEQLGCCPVCCAPCSVIKELLDADTLEDWVIAWPEMVTSTAWWDAERCQVDREWLARSWANTDKLGCHTTEDS